MIPVGYMSKNVAARPDYVRNDTVVDICSVCDCISDDFAEYITFWKHNAYWFFNTIADIEALCVHQGIDNSGNTFFFYEVFEHQYDRPSKTWTSFRPEGWLTNVERPTNASLLGFDVVTFRMGTSPECSPLSCNGLASEIAVNRHCLIETFDQAVEALETGKVEKGEAGPFRIFAVYRVEA